MQSKKLSLIESIVNVVSSFVIGVITQILVFPFYGLEISVMANISLTLIFSLTSFVRSYILRRIFNGISEKANEASSNECRDNDSKSAEGRALG